MLPNAANCSPARFLLHKILGGRVGTQINLSATAAASMLVESRNQFRLRGFHVFRGKSRNVARARIIKVPMRAC